jgi:hypothetical protein
MNIIPLKELKKCKYHCKNIKGYFFFFLGIFIIFFHGMILYRDWENIDSAMFFLLYFIGISLFIILLINIVSIFASRRYVNKLLIACKLSPQATEAIRNELEDQYGARLHWSVMINPPLLFFIGKILEHSPKTGKNCITNSEVAKNMMVIAVKYDKRLQGLYNDSPQSVATKLEFLNKDIISKILTSSMIKMIFVLITIIVMLLFFIIQILKIVK